MDDKFLVVYQRGFIGVNTHGLNVETNDKTVIDKVIDLRYNKTEQTDVTEVYNLNIVKIYRTLIEGILTKDKLTIVKAILVEAIRGFGSNDFAEWLELQKKSRYFSKHQQNFVLDTLRFIKTGKRETSFRTWEFILKKEQSNDTTHVSQNKNFDKEVEDFFNAIASDGKPINIDLNRILAQWLTHRNGHEDLILTLNILFGEM